MTSYNIAVTVSPNIFRSRENASADIFSHAIYYEAFICMIENYDYFFEESSEAAFTHNAVGKLEGFQGTTVEENKMVSNLDQFFNFCREEDDENQQDFRDSSRGNNEVSYCSDRSGDLLEQMKEADERAEEEQKQKEEEKKEKE